MIKTLIVSGGNTKEELLLDIYKEEELFNIERDLDLKVSKEFDKNQRDFLLREKNLHFSL